MNASRLGRTVSPASVAVPVAAVAARGGDGIWPESGASALAKVLLTGVAGGEMGRVAVAPHWMTSHAFAARWPVIHMERDSSVV
jgi:hypothetical protein